MTQDLPITVLIAALGGEGGGVLTDWLVTAATAEGLAVQSTSIPGVAQRTGATTYYVEVARRRQEGAAAGEPVMALYPAPGQIDIMVCSEVLEAGRALEGGFVSPDRTTLITSSHRVYSIAEKSAMGDGRFDAERIVAAARQMARVLVVDDFAALAKREGTVANAVLLGAIAATGVLPIPRARFEDAIRAGGIAVDGNLRGFGAGFDRVAGPGDAVAAEDGGAPPARRLTADSLRQRIDNDFPAAVRDLLQHGVERLVDYQGPRHAGRYLDRVARVVAVDDAARDFRLGKAVARHLALWMSYEDVIRVADLKTRAARMDRIRREVGAKPGEPIRVTEFLKPSADEVSAILPAPIGRALRRWCENHGGLSRWQRSMRVRTDTVSGFLRLWLLARMRALRPISLRHAEEEAAIGEWLDTITTAAELNYDLSVEIADCPRLLKGYSDTHVRGRTNYRLIMEEVVLPALSTPGEASTAAPRLAKVRSAALADPEGFELNRALAEVRSADSTNPTQTAEQQGG